MFEMLGINFLTRKNFKKKNNKFKLNVISVNDNDDLAPLLNSYTDVLRATYGDFYVAELIEAQNDVNKCLTAEVIKINNYFE
jgi:hypothetical protein